MKKPYSRSNAIFQDFHKGIFYEKIYEKYRITEDELICVLEQYIKGNYNYQRILRGGFKAQEQFLKHLKTRWNPLKPDAPWEDISPYL